MMDVYWVNAGKVSIGKYCSAQGPSHASQPHILALADIDHCRSGALQQLGETGVAMATLVRFGRPTIRSGLAEYIVL